jgi:hypothetical protein
VDLDNRLSFGDTPPDERIPEEEPEQAPEGRRPNRAFIFIAVAMGGLILLGVLALIGALAFYVPQQRAAEQATYDAAIAAATQTASAVTPTYTPSPTVLPTFTPAEPTWTPIPKPTNTRVVQTDVTPTKSATNTPRPVAEWGGSSGNGGTTGTTTPAAGLGGIGTAAIAVGLSGLVFAMRKLRSR